MKRINVLLLAAGLLLLGSCNKDDSEQEPVSKVIAPQMVATIEGSVATKAGVIEDNDYAQGEKFYWQNDDVASVIFYNGLDYMPAAYKAAVESGVKSNKCIFNEANGMNINPGDYTVYGIYPNSSSVWRKIFDDKYETTISPNQVQSDEASIHLSEYMPMKAKKEITMTGGKSFALDFKQLAAIFRVSVWNNSSNTNLKITGIKVSLNTTKYVFPTRGTLLLQNNSLIDYTSIVTTLNLELKDNAQNFIDKDGKKQCEGYMVVLPTEADAFQASDDLQITLSMTDGQETYSVTKSLPISTDASFLQSGIKQAESYYFRLKVDDTDFSTSYTVGDYWPDSTTPEGIVFWIDPSSSGTRGKVVGLGEEFKDKWGPDIDEKNGGVVGIDSSIDGSIGTINLISKYKDDNNFDTDYPAFYYVYKTVNGSDKNGYWYIPAIEEWKTLYNVYSSNKTDFNKKLTDKGGKEFGSIEKWIFTSTEESSTKCWCINVETGENKSDSKGFPTSVRWIRKF